MTTDRFMDIEPLYNGITYCLTQTEITHRIAWRLQRAALVLSLPDLADYPGECQEAHDRLTAEAIGWASR